MPQRGTKNGQDPRHRAATPAGGAKLCDQALLAIRCELSDGLGPQVLQHLPSSDPSLLCARQVLSMLKVVTLKARREGHVSRVSRLQRGMLHHPRDEPVLGFA